MAAPHCGNHQQTFIQFFMRLVVQILRLSDIFTKFFLSDLWNMLILINKKLKKTQEASIITETLQNVKFLFSFLMSVL